MVNNQAVDCLFADAFAFFEQGLCWDEAGNAVNHILKIKNNLIILLFGLFNKHNCKFLIQDLKLQI